MIQHRIERRIHVALILIIDDDADFIDSERTVLEGAGYEVAAATTPAEGVEKTKTLSPDLVILDVMMPSGYEGFEVARDIRETLGLRSLPVVLLTSLHAEKQVPYRFAPDENYLPVDVFLDKPATPEELLAVVRELLGERADEPETPL